MRAHATGLFHSTLTDKALRTSHDTWYSSSILHRAFTWLRPEAPRAGSCSRAVLQHSDGQRTRTSHDTLIPGTLRPYYTVHSPGSGRRPTEARPRAGCFTGLFYLVPFYHYYILHSPGSFRLEAPHAWLVGQELLAWTRLAYCLAGKVPWLIILLRSNYMNVS